MKERKFLTPWQLTPFHFILDPFHHLPGYSVVFHCFVPCLDEAVVKWNYPLVLY